MNKFRNYTIVAVMIVVTIGSIIAIRLVETAMDNDIKVNHLRYSGSVQGASPLVSFTTVALGSFRGILADLLWLRANKLQDKGDYYEMVQLARWITDLQPEFSGAAAYLAWNMAYNISVTCSFYDDRWRWVNEGLKLLRDRAIVYNPEDPVLYKELGWIFQHKIGDVLDDAQQYYKNQLANDMMLVVSDKPDWEGIAAAPENSDQFWEKYPAESPVGKAILKVYPENSLETLNQEFRRNSKVPDELALELKNNPAVIQLLDNYLRGEYLRDKYKLNPKMILELNNKYGEFDWRLPEAQSVYWATMGLKKTPGNRNLDCERMITQALFKAFIGGKMLITDNKEFKSLMLVPNFNVLDAARDTFMETIKANADVSSFKSAKDNFMKDAILMLYNYGKFTKAKEYFEELKKDNPGRDLGSLDDFAIKIFMAEIKDATYKKMMDIIEGRLQQSFVYLIYGDDDAALANEKIAKTLYAKHQLENKDVQRLLLPPYSQIKQEVVNKILANTPENIGTILKERLGLNKNKPEVETLKSLDDLDTSVIKERK